ncbi:hypothetical protein GPECTOR_96g737 [Gonium pectorale]|uniref:Cilia- and flagella-associated protein 300 n=1 Tax=Gonium pectorale TaxID=33097 RepID=A0A150G0C0_GONPE|nr:hypothetical protein GPECTOR_96g737 [Gonium pectorale]|eukprot:KXZ43271.1 hypothetical protein GPECTOR_96g737 [Gonium pectorale]
MVGFGGLARDHRDLLRNMKYMVVRYTKHYHKMQGQELLTDLFNDGEVQKVLQISDLLREYLLNEDSENAGLYTDEERDELLWRLFEHMVLGGSCSQFEDKLEPYVETSKRLYKELVRAQKDPGSGKIQVASVVYKVNAVCAESGPMALYPTSSRQNFFYAAIDPTQRLVKLLYHAYVPYW